MAIRITGMYSGLDTESIISELVSAKSVKKASLVKAQTKLSWKQDAWKALNTKIFDFYTNTLSNMRFQSSYMKKTTKISNTNAINVITGDNAVDGTRRVKVNKLAQGANITGGSLMTKDGICFSGAATLSQLRKYSELDNSSNLSGSFRVVGTEGAYVDFSINENTTINDVVDMLKSTGLNANYDLDSQRIFISSKNTGELNNFNLVANDEGGLNALACLGLLSAKDLASEENKTWAAYKNDDGTYTADYDKMYAEEVDKLAKTLAEANRNFAENNSKLAEAIGKLADENADLLGALSDTDDIGTAFAAKTGKTISTALDDLYGNNGLYDALQDARAAYDAVKGKDDDDQDKIDAKADLDAAQKAFDDAKAEISDFIDEVCYGPLEKVQAKDADRNPMFEADGITPIYEQQKDADGNPMFEDDGVTPIYVMERNPDNGLKAEYDEADKDGKAALQAKVDALNKLNDAFITMGENKNAITANEKRIEANANQITENLKYISVDGDGNATPTQDLKDLVQDKFDAKIQSAKDSLDIAAQVGTEGATNVYAKMATGTKVEAQDAEITIDGATFTSMTNTFKVNGLTLTALEETDKEITMTTSNDTDGIYDMIKNFFSEYNKLINEMDSLYNAESSKGYEPLTSEEKDAMSDSEIEEWEKKIKDSLLRRDSTLSSVSFAMVSIFLQGATVNGKKMYLSDFGINTLGYWTAKDNERNAYHIDGDPDDADTKANDDELKKMIASDPETVMNFFTQLSTNLYDKLTSQMSSTKLSSAFTVYNDKLMKDEYKDYTDKIAKQEEKLNAMMDKYYKKFSAMEVAMSKLESRSSSLASILGG